MASGAELSAADERYWLVGDEDCGVGIQCRVCDTGGAPIAYLGDAAAYAHTGVAVVQSIKDLLTTADAHGWHLHGWRPIFNTYGAERYDRATAADKPGRTTS